MLNNALANSRCFDYLNKEILRIIVDHTLTINKKFKSIYVREFLFSFEFLTYGIKSEELMKHFFRQLMMFEYENNII